MANPRVVRSLLFATLVTASSAPIVLIAGANAQPRGEIADVPHIEAAASAASAPRVPVPAAARPAGKEPSPESKLRLPQPPSTKPDDAGRKVLGDKQAAGRTSAPANASQRLEISVHAWRPLTKGPDERWDGRRTPLYTYVLVGDVGGQDTREGDGVTINARSALKELLNEVQLRQRIEAVKPPELLEHANQYCVPSRNYSHGVFELRHYDFDLANEYLNAARVAFSKHPALTAHLTKVGPFLIGTRKPISEVVSRTGGETRIDSGSPVVLVDLTGRHPKSMSAYIRAFEESSRKLEQSDSTVLAPLRPAFASAVLRVNEAVPFVAEAYAGTEKMFKVATVKAP